MIQWLRLQASSAMGTNWIPHDTAPKKKKKNCEKDIPGSGKLARGLFSFCKDLHFKQTEKELRIIYFCQVNPLRKGR